MTSSGSEIVAVGSRLDPVGRVVLTMGAQLVVLLNPGMGREYRVQIGDLLKIRLSRATVFGIVGGLSIPVPNMEDREQEMRIAEVVLVGEIIDASAGGSGNFTRGAIQMPSIEDDAYFANEDDSRLVYALPGRETIVVGTIHHSPDVAAEVDVNELLGKHFAVVGTTGTGKSSAVALILKGILENHPSSHILLLDPHGEYAQAFGDRAELLSVATLTLPYWIFNFEEFAEVVFGVEAKDSANEFHILRDLVVAAKQRFAGNAKGRHQITVDTPVPYTIGDLSRALDDAVGKLDNRSDVAAYLHIRARLNSLQNDRRYAFMFPSGLAVVDNLVPILGRIFRVPVRGKPLSILDLTGVPSEVLNVVVSVIARMAFDFALCSGHEVPLLLICEEAHRYAPNDPTEGFEPARRALARIAKEGRKYGISLCIVSQRPAELATTLLSQCSTIFALRMTNDRDQQIIQSAMTEASGAFLSALPVLGNAEAIVTGEGVALPMRIHFTELAPDQRPRSGTAIFSERWKEENSSGVRAIEAAIAMWRNQRPSDPSTPTA